MTKALTQVGRIALDMSQELAMMKASGVVMSKSTVDRIRQLAVATRSAFNITTESFQTPDIKVVKEAVRSTNEALELSKQTSREFLVVEDHGYSRILVSYLGQIASHCDVVMEITFHRLLRKTSRAAMIQFS